MRLPWFWASVPGSSVSFFKAWKFRFNHVSNNPKSSPRKIRPHFLEVFRNLRARNSKPKPVVSM